LRIARGGDHTTRFCRARLAPEVGVPIARAATLSQNRLLGKPFTSGFLPKYRPRHTSLKLFALNWSRRARRARKPNQASSIVHKSGETARILRLRTPETTKREVTVMRMMVRVFILFLLFSEGRPKKQ
jgi:hypothetical protein